MARPIKNTVDYYPHLIGDGKKIFFIEHKYKNDGYATWYKILEKLCLTEYHYLDLNKDEEVMFLAAKCNVSESVLLDIINDLSKMGVFDRFLWSNKIIWCPTFIESIQDAYKKRNNKCVTYDGLLIHLRSFCTLKHTDSGDQGFGNTQTKLKETKVNKTKLKESSFLTEADASVYKNCMAIYNDFILTHTGMKAKINGLTGKSLKSIIKYLSTEVKDKTNLTESIPAGWKLILDYYDRWDKFYQGQLNMNQIDSNLINIVNSIKNGHKLAKQPGAPNPTEAILASINPETFNT